MTGARIGTGGFTAHIRWQDVIAAGIRTTGGGPFEEDVFWQFLLPEGVVEVPGAQVVAFDELTAYLPGFDANKVIEAMSSCEPRVFRIWHREESRSRPDHAALHVRLERLFERLGARTSGKELATHVYSAWASDRRRYHDVEHLVECLREVDLQPEGTMRDVVELALWYHDAVYEAGGHQCESRSADWLLADASALGIPGKVADEAAALVRATAHTGAHATSDAEALVLDIDLAILGRDPIRFMEYEHGVEEEHATIPTAAFRRGRYGFLERLLDAPIYRSAAYRERFEAAARVNIGALLASERYRPWASATG